MSGTDNDDIEGILKFNVGIHNNSDRAVATIRDGVLTTLYCNVILSTQVSITQLEDLFDAALDFNQMKDLISWLEAN